MDTTQMIPPTLIERAIAQIIALQDRPEGWDGSAERLSPTSHTWISSAERPFDADEFMFVIDVTVKDKPFRIYHAPRTGKYNETSTQVPT